MNIFLWILQSLLAVHTLVGALWKLSNPAQIVPALQAIPAQAWLALAAVEVLCSAALILPAFNKSLVSLAPCAALAIGAEMLLFAGVAALSHHPALGEMSYWLLVAALCGFLAFGRLALWQRRHARSG